eukprot:COSAG04_NODE_3585_length_2690_cov_6.461598_4_plen_55_part_00
MANLHNNHDSNWSMVSLSVTLAAAAAGAGARAARRQPSSRLTMWPNQTFFAGGS